jgi:hypothetical protein
MIRSIVLFAHVFGMLTLFAGLSGCSWTNDSAHAAPSATLAEGTGLGTAAHVRHIHAER